MEALLWEALADQTVRCHVCPHQCLIQPNQRGVCGVRENQNGVLHSLAYGKSAAIQIDPMEKKPLYHYLPGTKTYSFSAVGCNLHCPWCQNWELSQTPKPKGRIEGVFVTPAQHVKQAVAAKCPSISYTYTEPIVWFEYALDTMKLAHEKGLKNIWVTAGYASDPLLDRILPYLDAANVDYKGTEQTYRGACGGHASDVLHTISRMKEAGVHVEVTTLLVPGENDDDEALRSLAKDLASVLGDDAIWHLSRCFPQYRKTDISPTPLSTLQRAEAIGRAAGIQTIHLGNVW